MSTFCFPRSRRLVLNAAVFVLLATAGCADLDVAAPIHPGGDLPRPVLAGSTPYFSASGTATIDGTLARGEWTGAATATFVANVPGGGTANVTLHVMSDATHLYLAVEYSRPVSDPNNVVQFRFRQGGLYDELVFASGTPQDRFVTEDELSELDTSAGGTSDVAGIRRNSGGRTVYEMSKKRNLGASPDPRDVVFGPDTPVEFQLHLIPGGSAAPSPFPTNGSWGWIEAAQPNDPTKPDVDVIVTGTDCEVTVTARNLAETEETGFRLRRAIRTNGQCLARFVDLPATSRWVFAVHNTVINDRAHFLVWPNAFDQSVPTPVLPNRQGAVFIENLPAPPWGSTAPLTPENYYLALAGAQPLPAPPPTPVPTKVITMDFQGPGQVVQCRFQSHPGLAFVYAMAALDPGHPLLPPLSSGLSALPPALGLYVNRTTSNADCIVPGLPNQHLVLEAIGQNGKIYRSLVGPDETDAPFEPDPDLVRAGYILDGWGDGDPLDIGLVVFGLEKDAQGNATNTFVITADVRGLQANGLATYEFELLYGPNHATLPTQALKVTLVCNQQGSGSCAVEQIQPAHQAPRVQSIEADLNPGTGRGWLTLRLDFTNVDVADLRMRSLPPGGGHDFAPDDSADLLKKFARWTREEGGNSLVVPF